TRGNPPLLKTFANCMYVFPFSFYPHASVSSLLVVVHTIYVTKVIPPLLKILGMYFYLHVSAQQVAGRSKRLRCSLLCALCALVPC
ncbi:hypothetical protein BKA70DRAFT_1326315, partial [Coprinopsis sp. MPI-PUGE-AT-0042]